MDEVGATAVRNLIDLSLQEGLDPTLLFAPAGLDWRDWVKTNRRLDWDDYCNLVERYADHLGGVEGCEQLGDRLPSASPTLTRMLGADLTLPRLYRLLARMVPEIWRNLVVNIHDDATGSLLLGADIAPASRGLLPFFALFTGTLRSAPRRLDQLASRIEVLDISPRMALWRVTPPRTRIRFPTLGVSFSAAWLRMFDDAPRKAVALFEELDRERISKLVAAP